MATPEITKRLHDLALITAESKKKCEEHFQIISEVSDILNDFKSKIIKCKNHIEKLYNVDEEDFNCVYCEWTKECEKVQERRKSFIEAQKSMVEERLKTSSVLLKQSEQLATLNTILKFYKILSTEFDYSAKKTTGFIFNANKSKCHGFELNPQEKEGNVKYLWKQLEKMYTNI